MKSLLLLGLSALLTCTGCQTRYTRLTVADHCGTPIATWVAEGSVKRHEHGYSIRAVERTTSDKPPIHSRYPNGWRSIVSGPNILLEPIAKPEWLIALDGE